MLETFAGRYLCVVICVFDCCLRYVHQMGVGFA